MEFKFADGRKVDADETEAWIVDDDDDDDDDEDDEDDDDDDDDDDDVFCKDDVFDDNDVALAAGVVGVGAGAICVCSDPSTNMYLVVPSGYSLIFVPSAR